MTIPVFKNGVIALVGRMVTDAVTKL